MSLRWESNPRLPACKGSTLSTRPGSDTGEVGWLVVLGLTALRDSISVYIGPSPKEREKEERKDR